MAALTLSMSAVLPPLLVGTMAERMRTELGIGETALGLAIATLFVTSGLMSTIGGRLADRVGWARAGRVAVLGSGGALVGIALLVRSGWGLMGFLALAGAAMAVALPAGSLAIAKELPAERQGLLFGVKQASIPLAGILAGGAVPVVALTFGWRWAFGLAAAFPLLTFILLPSSSTPGNHAWATTAGEKAQDSLPTPYRLLTFGGGCAAVALSAMTVFPLITAVDAGISEGQAGVLVSLASALGLTTRVMSGWVADYFRSSGLSLAAWMMLIGVVGLALLAIPAPVTVVIGTLVAYGVGWGWTGLVQLGAVSLSPRSPGAATGRLQLGLSTGSAFGPLLFGVLAETAGLSWAWATTAVFMTIGALVVREASRRLGDRPVVVADENSPHSKARS